MIKSINQPWAISDKFQNKYGDIWTNIDFIMHDKISAENFKTDPMNMFNRIPTYCRTTNSYDV
jgi:hypothetical protein